MTGHRKCGEWDRKTGRSECGDMGIDGRECGDKEIGGRECGDRETGQHSSL